MPGKGCKKKGRKHTEIKSEQQRKFFGAVVSGTAKTPHKGLSKAEARRHLKEVKGKKLPKKARKKKHG